MFNIRIFFITVVVLFGLMNVSFGQAYTPVITPNGTTMPWTFDKDGAKVFRITVGFCKHEIAPGMTINAWCYNGQTPGPTIEVVEGDLLRIYVTNKLQEGDRKSVV